jgi:hypothetical protein
MKLCKMSTSEVLRKSSKSPVKKSNRTMTITAGAVMLLSSCSSITTSRTTSDAQIGQVAVTKYGVDGYYRPAGIVTAEATVTVTFANGGKQRVVAGEDFQIDFDNDNRTDRAASQFYVGNSLPVVTAGGSPMGSLNGMASMGGASAFFHDDKQYATDTVNYRLIKKARSAGAVAFLDEPIYEWSIQEESKYDTIFTFLQLMQSKKIVYKVIATAQTATIDYRMTVPPAPGPSKATPATVGTSSPEVTPGAFAASGNSSGASSSASSGAEPPTTEASTRIDVARKGLLDLDTATVRALKQLVGSDVAVTITSGEVKKGTLGKVDRPGLVVAGASVAWDTVVSVEQAK